MDSLGTQEYGNIISISQRSAILDRSGVKKQTLHQDLERMADGLQDFNQQKCVAKSLDETLKSLVAPRARLKSNNLSSGFMNKNKLGLRKVLEQQKIKNIVRHFRTKLRRNISSSSPIEYQPYQKQENQGIWVQKGIKFPLWLDVFISVLSIAIILLVCFVYPLDIVFTNFISDKGHTSLQSLCILFYLFEIITNFIIVKNVQGRKVTLMKDIFVDYLKRKFPIDFICFIIILIDVTAPSQTTRYLRLSVLFKIKECMEKPFAHLLAILLIAMTNLSPDQNWLQKMNANNAPWYQQYTWAYYWGCTIMLTVGFGDLTATNYKQAICITFIETFSCILLAYNINCVGNLINNIRQQDIEKNKNLKIMRRLAEENNITEELESKVCNYIGESDKMKKKFGFQAEKQFVSALPQELKADFLKESNIKIFQNLRFFTNFTEKTLLTLAQFIQIKIAHPEEIILKIDNKPEFIILKEGEVGFCTKRNGFQFNGTVVDLLKVGKKQCPLVLDLNFLRWQLIQAQFQIKSINYSMIYKIPLQDLIETLKNTTLDFQYFCQERDKSRHIMDEYQVLVCPHCPTKHSKMRCPKLHYIPLKQMIVYKYLSQVRVGINQRQQQILRPQKRPTRTIPLKLNKYFRKMEEQIYLGTNYQNMEKTVADKEAQVPMFHTDNIDHSLRTFDEAKFTMRMEMIMLEKLGKILDQQNFGRRAFWDLEVDEVSNFKYYFPQINASQLPKFLQISKKNNQIEQNKKIAKILMQTLLIPRNFLTI